MFSIQEISLKILLINMIFINISENPATMGGFFWPTFGVL